MIAQDFSKYSLCLIKDDKIIYSSTHSGLRPLFDCIEKNKGTGYTLYDKVTGLASARLIIYSQIASKLITNVISKKALDYLNKKIELNYDKVVDNILDKERKSICPMEQKAMELKGESFIAHIESVFGSAK
jgi:hypothetical protein